MEYEVYDSIIQVTTEDVAKAYRMFLDRNRSQHYLELHNEEYMH